MPHRPPPRHKAQRERPAGSRRRGHLRRQECGIVPGMVFRHGKSKWVADACLPLAPPFPETFDIPAKDNVGEAQRNQAVWVDVYVPSTATPGKYTGTITIRAPGAERSRRP